MALYRDRGPARNFVREGPVTDVVRFQTLAILQKNHFDVTSFDVVVNQTVFNEH